MVTSCSANYGLFCTYNERGAGSTLAARRSIQAVRRVAPKHPQKVSSIEPFLHPPEPFRPVLAKHKIASRTSSKQPPKFSVLRA